MTVHIQHKNGKVTYPGGSEVPQVSNLFIDMLTMTLSIPKEFHHKVVAGFHHAYNHGWGKKDYKTAYSNGLKLTADFPHDEGNILIHCAPKKTTHNFFRIEFNPSHANLDHLKTVLDHILPGGYASLISSGIVTRIDFTVDVSYLDATDVIAMYPKMKVEKHIGKGGVTESKYLGAIGSNKLIVLYDKAVQIAEMNKKKPAGLKKPVPSDKLLRVEFRLLKTGYTLKEIETVPNPFEHLTLIAFPGSKSPQSYDPTWTLFLSVCRNEGIPSALSHFNDQDQAHYTHRLNTEGRKDWWKPEQVWSGLPAALKAITSPKGYTPTQTLVS